MPKRKTKQSAAAKAARAERTKRARIKREVIRIVEYLISGGLYFWAGYGAFFVLDSLLGWSLLWAKLTASVFGWVVNYALQRFWVFHDPKLNEQKIQVTTRYAIITLVDFILDYLIVAGLNMLGISPYIGQFASAAFFTVWNYFWYKVWVFTNKQPHKPGRRKASKR